MFSRFPDKSFDWSMYVCVCSLAKNSPHPPKKWGGGGGGKGDVFHHYHIYSYRIVGTRTLPKTYDEIPDNMCMPIAMIPAKDPKRDRCGRAKKRPTKDQPIQELLTPLLMVDSIRFQTSPQAPIPPPPTPMPLPPPLPTALPPRSQ